MKFYSKYAGLKVVIKPKKYLYTMNGDRVFVQGKMAEFRNHFFETKDQEIIDGLKKAVGYGVEFWAVDDEEKVKVSEETKIAQQEIEEGKTFTCPSCGKEFKNAQNLKFHLKSHQK